MKTTGSSCFEVRKSNQSGTKLAQIPLWEGCVKKGGGVSRRGQYVGWRKSSLDNFDLAPSHLSRPTFARRCIAADQSLVLSDSASEKQDLFFFLKSYFLCQRGMYHLE